MKTYLANPSGYCEGVARAISLAYSFKKTHPNVVTYALGPLVHNESVMNELSKCGIITLLGDESNEEKIKKLPNDVALIYSAHGHDEKLDILTKAKNITTIDTTCPMVSFAKNEIKKKIKEGREVIYIGTKAHPETISMLSVDKNVHLFTDIKEHIHDFIKDKSPFVSNQTTIAPFELEDIYAFLKKEFPTAQFQNEICKATRLRQEAIKKLPNDVDVVFIVGGKNSSNTRKLYELAKQYFTTLRIYRILDENDIDKKALKGLLSAAIIAGTSTPINEIIKIRVKLEDIW